jgi:hypothetical protein
MWCCVVGRVVPRLLKEHGAFRLQRSGSLRRTCLTRKVEGSTFPLCPYFKLSCIFVSVTETSFVISVHSVFKVNVILKLDIVWTVYHLAMYM